MWVLGINWRFHDASAALVDGTGRVVALAEEERFSRVKHAWDSLPRQAVAHCLERAGITWRELDAVAMGWDLRLLRPWATSDTEELYGQLFGPEAAGAATAPPLEFVEHHLAHANSAFYASGFAQAGVLVVDGSGEHAATSIYEARHGEGLTLRAQWSRAYSLGSMYEAATQHIGFGELQAGKTMGLAPYGTGDDHVVLPHGDMVTEGPWANKRLLDLPKDASDPEVIGAWRGYLEDRFGRAEESPERLHLDPVAVRVAASAQATVEEAMRTLYTETRCLTGYPEVCLAGGVALNSVSNGRHPEPVYIPPFPHDAGVALGAAWQLAPAERPTELDSPYLGRELTVSGELDLAREAGLRVSPYEPEVVLGLLSEGAVGAVAEGRAEVGPRALGHRSIIAIPRPAAVRDRINVLKGRELWRPLAPVTLAEHAPRLWPGQGRREWYMVGTSHVSREASRVMPAAAHVDGTTRPQVLRPGAAPALQALLHGLTAEGQPPVLVNTSFNGRGEPIVDSATDALRAFTGLGLDFLVLGEHLIRTASR